MDGYWIFFQFIYGMYVKLANPIQIHFFQPGTRVVIGGTVDGRTYVGEGFIFGYSPPILGMIQQLRNPFLRHFSLQGPPKLSIFLNFV